MTKYTPGPWMLRTTPTSAGLCHIVSAADGRGAFIYGDGIRKGVDDALPKAQELAANARLIAAAPDLLEALQWYEAKAVQMGRAAIDQDSKLLLELMKEIAVEYGARARAAIAKAIGEQL